MAGKPDTVKVGAVSIPNYTNARGFRNLNYPRAISYWVAGKLTLNLPSLQPT